MAAEVGWRGGRSSLEKIIIDKERTEGHHSKVTEGKAFIHFGDLLGGGGGGGEVGGSWRVKEVDLDVQMPLPSGWEKRLDMKSGEVYFHNCNAPAKDAKNSREYVHDLNFPPPLSLPYTAFNDKKGAGTEAEANKETSPEVCESQWLNKMIADRNTEAEAKAKAKPAVRGLEELNFMGGSPNSENRGEAKMKSGDMVEGQCKPDLKLSDVLRQRHHVEGSDWEWQCQSQSVCTLDKVKMALKRAEKESSSKNKGVTTSSQRSIEMAQVIPSNSSSGNSKKRSRSVDRSSSSSSGSSLCLSIQPQPRPQPQPQPWPRPSINLHSNGSERENKAPSNSLQAAGCPRCLLYVLLPKTNPKCPRCGFLIANDFLSSSSSSSCSSAAAACKKPCLNGLGLDISGESMSISARRAASHVGGSNGARPSLLFDLNTVSFSD